MTRIKEEEIFIVDVIKHCIEKQNFSCAYIQKTFEMPYPLAGRVIAACEELGIIQDGPTNRKIITLEEWQKDYDKYAKKLIKKGLF